MRITRDGQRLTAQQQDTAGSDMVQKQDTPAMQEQTHTQFQAYSGMMLTIGMIVRNEAVNLKRCFDSLQPLRDAIPCELLITDTGSTDETVAVAEATADAVYHVKWADDFAAARNTTLEAAQGEWYFYIDADECLDADFSALTQFFRDGTHMEYDVAACTIREYADASGQQYAAHTCPRLYRMRSGLHFQHRVFEQIESTAEPYPLQMIVHHYGYADAAVKLEKYQRNLRLLELEQQEHPEDGVLTERIAQLKAEKFLQNAALQAAQGRFESQQYAEAEGAIAQVQFTALEEERAKKTYIALVIQLAKYKQYGQLAPCYGALLAADAQPFLLEFQKHFQQELSMDKVAYEVLAQLEQDDPFLILCRLRTLEENDQNTAYALLDCLQGHMELTMSSPYEDILYWSVRLNHGILLMIEEIRPEELAKIVKKIVAMHDDFAQVVLHWVKDLQGNRQNLLQLHWISELMVLTLIYSYAYDAQLGEQAAENGVGAKRVSAEVGTALFFQATAALMLLCKKTYRAEALCEENLEYLPQLHCMAFYTNQAMRKKESKDIVGYVQNLKEAAKAYPLLSKPIHQIDAQLQQEMNAEKTITDEFYALAQQVKQQTAALIARGEFQEAEKILEVYQSVHPDDQEAVDMYQMLRSKHGNSALLH